jgi:hypothetical protein
MTNAPLQQEVEATIRAARDSVWVINNEIAKKTAAGSLSDNGRGNIERNVAHLEIVTSSPDIINSGQDISDLLAAITDGKAALSA